MEKIVIKYLVTLNEELNDVYKLANLLESRSTLEIKNKALLKDIEDSYRISLELVKENRDKGYDFEMHKINIKSITKKQYFILLFEFNDIDSAEQINREIKKVIAHIDDANVELLNDGISKYYSVKSYEKLHDVENLIRAFITELMVFYGKPDWVRKEAKEILNLQEEDVSKGIKVLYSRNFDQLREFLFTDYSDTTYKQLVEDIIKEHDENKKNKLINELDKKIPKTNWEKLVKKDANKNSISSEQYEKLLESIYGKRNKIAHCNEFNKSDFQKFNADCDQIIKQTEELLQIIETNKNDKIMADNEIGEDISAIFSPLDAFDTIIVPAKENGFKEEFLGGNRWYSVSIYEGRKPYIRYIAAYVTAPVKKITHYAEVERIDISPYDEKKKIIIFKNPAIELENKIELGEDRYAFQRSRYTTFEKLRKAKSTDDLFM